MPFSYDLSSPERAQVFVRLRAEYERSPNYVVRTPVGDDPFDLEVCSSGAPVHVFLLVSGEDGEGLIQRMAAVTAYAWPLGATPWLVAPAARLWEARAFTPRVCTYEDRDGALHLEWW